MGMLLEFSKLVGQQAGEAVSAVLPLASFIPFGGIEDGAQALSRYVCREELEEADWQNAVLKGVDVGHLEPTISFGNKSPKILLEMKGCHEYVIKNDQQAQEVFGC